MEQWTFLLMCGHLSHHPTLSIWQQATRPWLNVWHRTLFLTWHPLIAWLPTFPPTPLSNGFCHAASTTSHVLLQGFSLAGRQCPCLGTKYWKELQNENQPQSLPPTILLIVEDQRQFVMGILYAFI